MLNQDYIENVLTEILKIPKDKLTHVIIYNALAQNLQNDSDYYDLIELLEICKFLINYCYTPNVSKFKPFGGGLCIPKKVVPNPIWNFLRSEGLLILPIGDDGNVLS